RVLRFRLRAGEVGLRLPHRSFEWARVDREQAIALLHFLALAEVHLGHLAVDARFHVDAGERFDRTDSAQLHGYVLLDRGGGTHWDDALMALFGGRIGSRIGAGVQTRNRKGAEQRRECASAAAETRVRQEATHDHDLDLVIRATAGTAAARVRRPHSVPTPP